MRIAVGTFGAPDGGETMKALAGALAERGHTVSLVVGGAEPCPDRRTGFEEFLGALQGCLDDTVDVVHTSGWLAGLGVQLSLRRRGGHRRPTLIHSVDPPAWDDAGVRSVPEERANAEAIVLRVSDRVITTYQTDAHDLIRAGVSRGRIRVVPPGVGGAAGPDTGVRAPRGRGPYRVVIVGVPRHRIRMSELIGGLRRLPDVEVTVCDTDEDPLGGLLDTLAAEPGAPAVAAPPSGVARYELVRSADLVVSAERVGAVHLEAMSAGVPVIALTSAVAEAVVDRVTGVHAVHATIEQLLATVRTLLKQPSKRHGMALAAQDRAVNRYGWPRIAAETALVYLEAGTSASTG